MSLYPTIAITKMAAARSQLSTAIRLWFEDGDPVSIHTLAYAAYEVIHVISKKRNRSDTLIFDSILIRDEYRKDYNVLVKKHANFFKHANNDANSTIDFPPQLSELFILFSIHGIQLCNEPLTDVEAGYLNWISVHQPDLLTERGRERLAKSLSVDQLSTIRTLKKGEFLHGFLGASDLLRRWKNVTDGLAQGSS